MSRLTKILKGREIAICGIGKFQEDFEYVFDTLKPKFYISDDFAGKLYKELPVYRTYELKEADLNNVLIVVCDLTVVKSGCEKRDWNRLEDEGYNWGKDYIFADELFQTLDFDWKETANGRKIAIWGTGAESRKLYITNKIETTNLRPDVFVDMDESKCGKLFNGVEILHPSKLENLWHEYYVVVMTNDYYHEVYEYLSVRGLHEIDDFVSYHLIYDRTYALPSEMMRKTVYASPIEGQPFCKTPFNMIHLRLDGHAIGCTCPEYSDKWFSAFGNYNYEPYERIWQSASAKIFRLSILNNTYCFCLEKVCDIMKPERKENINVARRAVPKDTEIPTHVFSEMDDVCNLRCPSCRVEPKYIEYGKEYQMRRVRAEKLVQSGWLEKAPAITIAGHGEVFYSKIYRSLLFHENSEKRNHITILSNGILFNENEFLHLMENYKSISAIISVDGTRKETYEKLRPGANFDILMRNLKMLSRQKKCGNLNYWQLNFVVQRENYLQMKEIINLAEEWGVDKVQFIHIMNWLYPQEEFDKMSMSTQDGALKPELVEYLKDPIFDKPLVAMPWFKSRMNMLEKEEDCK
ncbi:MAG: radical SAM protein [Lachnospiraceae bacterium]|nr:radical SAM protein [Lachnospiraceae bacterium]